MWRDVYWLDEAPPVEAAPAAEGAITADVVVVGGGYAGMWSAIHLAEIEPEADVVLLESGVCGNGPSGRNGGMVNSLWHELGGLRERFGEGPALALARAGEEAVGAIGRWCEREGVDAWYQPQPHLGVASSPGQDDRWLAATDACAELGFGDRYRPLDAAEVRERFRSPVARGGAILAPGATVQPGRLARGMRRVLLDRGVRVFERSAVRRVRQRDGAVRLVTDGATVRASRAIVAVNAALASWPRFRTRLAVASSHMVITEPVPDVLDAYGWARGPAVSDHKTLLHYMRPTRDRRIAIGWGGGPMGFGGRPARRLERDRHSSSQALAGLVRFFPELAGRRITHRWGGWIDVSPIHLPVVETDGAVSYAYGFTGNGVGPSWLIGRMLAAVALERRSEHTRLALLDPADLPRFPPEPLRYLGGVLIRRALIRRDAAEARGDRPGPITARLAALPRRLEMNLPR